MKPKTLFEHIDAIYTKQTPDYYRELSDIDKKSFNNYMITRGVSMNLNFVQIANVPNLYWGQMQSEQIYRFYIDVLPKGKQYNKWIKSTKSEEHEEWVVELVCKRLQCSTAEAERNIDILMKTDAGRASLKETLEAFGTDPKKINKLKL